LKFLKNSHEKEIKFSDKLGFIELVFSITTYINCNTNISGQHAYAEQIMDSL
jgi:hypothetical protein